MGRLKADGLLLIAAAIWGTTFIAQKTAMDDLGSYTFTALRFAIAALFVFPLALREARAARAQTSAQDESGCPPARPGNAGGRDGQDQPGAIPLLLIGVGAAFAGGALFQQVGLETTSASNAGFLTALYVLIVPFAMLVLFRETPRMVIWPAAALAVFGVWLLSGGELSAFSMGDWLMLPGALGWALHVVLLGEAVRRTHRPLTVVAWQYVVTALICLPFALAFETTTWSAIWNAGPELLYAGVVSGGIAFSLQAIAQRYTPASDAAVIMSTESLFAAVSGALLLGERLAPVAMLGGGVILLAVLIVELAPHVRTRRAGPSEPPVPPSPPGPA